MFWVVEDHLIVLKPRSPGVLQHSLLVAKRMGLGCCREFECQLALEVRVRRSGALVLRFHRLGLPGMVLLLPSSPPEHLLHRSYLDLRWRRLQWPALVPPLHPWHVREVHRCSFRGVRLQALQVG